MKVKQIEKKEAEEKIRKHVDEKKLPKKMKRTIISIDATMNTC